MESVVLETSMGDVQLELYWNHAPKASNQLSMNHCKTHCCPIQTCRRAKTSQNLQSGGTTIQLCSTESSRYVNLQDLAEDSGSDPIRTIEQTDEFNRTL
jgi:cyclophilin family peptidyl-prolyl cis-trans isomerase